VDPLAIATDILMMRSEVLMDWKDIVENTPSDHTELRKSLLTQQSKNWGNNDISKTEEGSTTNDDMGVFE
jgi:hypothetical protein